MTLQLDGDTDLLLNSGNQFNGGSTCGWYDVATGKGFHLHTLSCFIFCIYHDISSHCMIRQGIYWRICSFPKSFESMIKLISTIMGVYGNIIVLFHFFETIFCLVNQMFLLFIPKTLMIAVIVIKPYISYLSSFDLLRHSIFSMYHVNRIDPKGKKRAEKYGHIL